MGTGNTRGGTEAPDFFMRWQQSYQQGENAEVRFSRVLTNPETATTHQNIHEHWDLKDKDFKYDVKAMKKWNRSDKEPTDRIHFIELKNVRGDRGWLYGEADYIVFETRAHWVLVNRPKLQTWIDGMNLAQSTEKEIYKLYSRVGRKDLMTIVPTMDLVALSDQIIKK